MAGKKIVVDLPLPVAATPKKSPPQPTAAA